MRMRKKKHLEKRLEAVNDYLLIAELPDLNFKTAKNNPRYLNFSDIYEKEQPLYLEIGCGKGQFIIEMAKRHQEYNFLAVEKVGNVIVSGAEEAKRLGLKNLYFLQCNAEYLPCFLPPNSVSGIYLNFSCPFPKKAYACHRLTNRIFLKMYREFLKPEGEIHQKTDNQNFFEYSIEEFSASGYRLKNISLDLHKSDFQENITTEYEEKFVSQGLPIYRLEAWTPEKEEKE